MSRFMDSKYQGFVTYSAGEQPKDRTYVKLNTNESPYPPSPKVLQAISKKDIEGLRLYNDPEATALCAALAQYHSLAPDQVLCGNGSDELLVYAFMAWSEKGAAFADVTYGLYPVAADLCGIPVTLVPLREGFVLDDRDYWGLHRLIVIANPNAPSGLAIQPRQIALIAEQNPDTVVMVDEAYVDFGASSCAPLIGQYPNLAVVRTYSKSRSLAGGRLGYIMAQAPLIEDLRRIKNAINPYNVSSLTQLMGLASLEDEDYFRTCCAATIRVRDDTAQALSRSGFDVMPSKTNFLFVKHPALGGEMLYMALRKRGYLVRHFRVERTRAHVRISVGSKEQMEGLVEALQQIAGGARA